MEKNTKTRADQNNHKTPGLTLISILSLLAPAIALAANSGPLMQQSENAGKVSGYFLTAVAIAPWLIASVSTAILVWIVRKDNRFRMGSPFSPLTILKWTAVFGIPLGMFAQWGMSEMITFLIGAPTMSFKGVLVAGVFSVPGSVVFHFALAWWLKKTNHDFYYEWIVRHLPGIHNCDNNDTGFDDDQRGDGTIISGREDTTGPRDDVSG
jgi:hypothetical protein